MDFREVYARYPERYHALVSAEDVDGNLLHALRDVLGARPGHVVDVGAGTGRVSRLLLELGAKVTAIEPEAAMLALAQHLLADPAREGRIEFAQADGRALPLADGVANAAVAGWVFGHLRYWEDQWQEQVRRALSEMDRVVASGGDVIVIETLGTARLQPGAPNERLDEYYAWLEAEGFERRQFATDYGFANAEAAATNLEFFFGAETAACIRNNGWARVPEWTGLWARRKSSRTP